MRRPFAASVLLLIIALSPARAFDPFIVQRARADIGKTAKDLGLHRFTLWCSAYLKHITGRTDVDDRAKSWARLPRVAACTPGSIAVMTRGKGGGHAGVVEGCDRKGNPKIISGNHLGRVGVGVYPRSRVYAYVMP